MGQWKGWEGYEPPPGTKDPFKKPEPASSLFDEPPAPAPEPKAKAPAGERLDRGRRLGAKWCYVLPNRLQVPYVRGKKPDPNAILFKSLKEARFYVYLLSEQDAGRIAKLQRQVRYSLQTRTPEGLMVHVCNYLADFTYVSTDDNRLHVVDVKGRRGPNALREDTYKLKRDWLQKQYGLEIEER